MKSMKIQYVAPLVGVFFVLICANFLFDVTVEQGAAQQQDVFQWTYLSEDSVQQTQALEEQLLLLDSMPIFIPTQWNASQGLFANGPIRLDRSYGAYEPEISRDHFTIKSRSYSEDNHSIIRHPGQLFSLRNGQLLERFGDLKTPVKAFAQAPKPGSELGLLVSAGEAVISLELTLPDTADRQHDQRLDPVALIVRYQPSHARPMHLSIYRSSGDIGFDVYAEEWIRLNFRKKFASQAGCYSIRVYPSLN